MRQAVEEEGAPGSAQGGLAAQVARAAAGCQGSQGRQAGAQAPQAAPRACQPAQQPGRRQQHGWTTAVLYLLGVHRCHCSGTRPGVAADGRVRWRREPGGCLIVTAQVSPGPNTQLCAKPVSQGLPSAQMPLRPFPAMSCGPPVFHSALAAQLGFWALVFSIIIVWRLMAECPLDICTGEDASVCPVMHGLRLW